MDTRIFNKTDILRATAILRGKVFWRCARAANMAMFDFGARKKILDSRGAEKEVGEVALHVHCRWRIAGESQIFVGDRDINYPAEYREGQEIPEEFDWDRDLTRLDKLARLFFEHHDEQLIVESVEAGNAGSLRISLSGGSFLELFPDDSLNDENWRLFEPGRDLPHFVVKGQGHISS